MIRSLRIRNFQSHEDTTLALHPGVNVLIGSSDQGKSAVVRAIRWVVLNLPRGERYRSRWGGDTEVELVLQDGVVVSRTRTNKVNGYSCQSSMTSSTGNVWKALASGVPEEVQQILRLSEVNLQLQHDASFMLAQSPADLARFLNNMVGLELIDGATSYANGMRIGHTTREGVLVEDITRLEERKKELDTVVKDGETVDGLEEVIETFESTYSSIKRVSVLQGEREVALSRLKAKNPVRLQSDLITVTKVIQDGASVIEQMRTHGVVSRLLQGMKDAQKEIAAKEVNPHDVEAIEEAEANAGRQSGLRDKITAVGRLMDKALELEEAVMKKLDSIKCMESEFEAEFPEECPLCGAPKNWVNR